MIYLVSFRTFRRPIFPKPVSWFGLFCRFLQQDYSSIKLGRFRIQDWLLTCDDQDKWCEFYIFRSPCLHGTCSNLNIHQNNSCICEEGWKGESCDACVPYWNCPNQGQDACLFPNECHCSPGQNDTKGLCFHEDLDKSGIESSAVIGSAPIGSCLDNICQIDGSIRITEGYEFSENLLNPDSVEYKELKQMIEEEVRTYIHLG